MKVKITIRSKSYECEVNIDDNVIDHFGKIIKDIEEKAKRSTRPIDEILQELVVEMAYNIVALNLYIEVGGMENEKKGSKNNLTNRESKVATGYINRQR